MRPPSFHADHHDDWYAWLLDERNPLPELPTVLRDDDAVPVARFIGARFATILMIEWGGDSGDLYVSSEIEVFRRSLHGWEPSDASGGGGWSDPPFARPTVDPEYAVLGHQHESVATDDAGAAAEWSYSAGYGWTGVAARSVEVDDRDGVTARSIESPLGVFMFVADARGGAVVRVRSSTGKVLLEHQLPSPWESTP